MVSGNDMQTMFSFYFDVEAEIAHFRDPTSHAFLNTFLAPPPHTIIGLLGNCCNFSEEQTEEELAKNVKVGCTVLSLRGYLKDLVMMANQKGGKQIKFPRTRKFLVGPKYRIYVGSQQFDLLSKVMESVMSPKRVPYLGISDCLAYIRNISGISHARYVKLKETDSVVAIEGNSDQVEYSAIIKSPISFTVYPDVIYAPRYYQITKTGRKPVNQKKLLMSLNCKIRFRKMIDGFEINGENVCLI